MRHSVNVLPKYVSGLLLELCFAGGAHATLVPDVRGVALNKVA